MKGKQVLIYVLVFVLGFMVSKMMRCRLVEGQTGGNCVHVTNNMKSHAERIEWERLCQTPSPANPRPGQPYRLPGERAVDAQNRCLNLADNCNNHTGDDCADVGQGCSRRGQLAPVVPVPPGLASRGQVVPMSPSAAAAAGGSVGGGH